MTLFDANHVILPRVPTATQIEAAGRALPKTGTQRRRLFDAYLRMYPDGLTDDEATAVTRILPNSLRPRRNELMAEGLVAASEAVRRNRNGNAEIVYQAVLE